MLGFVLFVLLLTAPMILLIWYVVMIRIDQCYGGWVSFGYVLSTMTAAGVVVALVDRFS